MASVTSRSEHVPSKLCSFGWTSLGFCLTQKAEAKVSFSPFSHHVLSFFFGFPSWAVSAAKTYAETMKMWQLCGTKHWDHPKRRRKAAMPGLEIELFGASGSRAKIPDPWPWKVQVVGQAWTKITTLDPLTATLFIYFFTFL